MARLDSISVGGYYPTPSRVLPLIASLFKVEPEAHYNYLDPCAGEGEAVLTLIKTLHGEERKAVENVDLRCVEMELTRYASLKEACGTLSWHWGSTQNALHCDAFCVRFKVSKGVSLLYLNPPYDTDPVCGRLEEKFLVRFTPTLMAGGLLVFLVPFYALAASAKTLAKEYSSVACFRFPEPEFSGYKQVALIATKREAALFELDPKIEAKVQKWAKDAASIPVLEEGAKTFTVPQSGKWGKPFDTWKTTSVDFAGLLERVKPWSVTDRAGKTQPLVGIMPEGAVEDLLIRHYPVAMPPRSAHIAAGIAAGIFNGSRINPDNPKSSLPPILVKGVFDKEFRTVEEKEDKEGNVKALVQVQQPKLVTTVLDLRNSTYHTIKTSADQTGSQDLATMTMADLLAEYGRGLMEVMLQQCPVLHDPGRPEHHIKLADVARPLFKAQDHATQASVKLLGGLDATKASRRFKSAFVLGEIGSGKCLGLGTPVLRFDGTVVPVEEIRTGDLLMGPDSTPRRVLGTTRGVGPLFKVRPTVGAPWVCNDAHILTLVHTQSDDVLDIPLQELLGSKRIQRPLSKAYIWRKKGKTSRRTTHPVSEFKQFFPALGVDFPQAPAPSIDPYFLGIWYGDGTKDLGSVSVTTADREVVEVLKEVAEKHGLSVRSTLSPKRCPTYTLTQGRVGGRPNPLLNQLREVVGNGAHLPQNYLTGSRETRRAFLAGLLDSDGHYSRGGVFDFIQKNKCWAEDVCFLARSLGIRATISTVRKSAYRGEKGDVYWRVCLSGELSDVPTRLRRKQARPRAQTRRNVKLDTSSGTRRMPQVNRTSIKIEAVGEGPYAGFELDGDGRFLLGDFTVTHNTSVALATAETIKSKRTLVMCPPHLLQSWTDQAAAVVPWVRVVVLNDIVDMQKLATSKDEGPILAILSREAGKLGHGYASVAGICPGCGEELADRDFAKKREVCDAKRLRPRDVVGRTAINLALSLVKVFPHDYRLSQILRTRPLRALIERLRAAGEDEDTKPGFDYAGWKAAEAAVDTVIDVLLQDEREGAWHAILALLMAAPKAARVLRVARAVFAQGDLKRTRAALLLVGDSPEVAAFMREVKEGDKDRYYDPWKAFDKKRAYLHTGEGDAVYDWETEEFKREKDAKTFTWKGCEYGDPKSAAEAVGFLSTTVFFGWSKECGTPLFQAIPEPRRFPIATFIARRYPNFFDLLILDECFVAGTRVSGRPIETIQVGDFVDSFDENSGTIVARRVARLWVKQPKSLVRVHFSDGRTFVCTPNHPLWTVDGWVAAGLSVGKEVMTIHQHGEPCLGRPLQMVSEELSIGWPPSEECQEEGLRFLQPHLFGQGHANSKQRATRVGRELQLVQESHPIEGSGSGGSSEAGVRLLRRGVRQVGEERWDWESECCVDPKDWRLDCSAHASQQPLQTARSESQDQRFDERSDLSCPRGQRQANSPTTSIGRGFGVANRSCDQNVFSGQSVHVPPALLQGGHRQRNSSDCGRGGWALPQDQEVEILGPPKGRGASGTRVDRVEVLEPGCDGTFGGVCPDGLVYNLEVEETHTYFAEGVLVHNCHEYATDGAAQERSAHRLTSLGLPTLALTGTIMNGYAESMFTNMWALSKEFRHEFDRDERLRFVDRYGYRKRLVEDRDKKSGEIVEYGSMSDRVERMERTIGHAPGVLPLFLLKYLLPQAVTLHKTDLSVDIPACTEHVQTVVPEEELLKRYRSLERALLDQIRKDRFEKDLAGKLWGAMADLPSYLDLATEDTGNRDGGCYSIRYPESVGGGLVAAAEPFPLTMILPKEAWLLDQVQEAIDSDRNVMVFAWHTALLPRLARLLEKRLKTKCPILDPGKVPTKKRQAWIDEQIVAKRRRVLVVNPVAIQTGLNNLVYFSDQIWMENPMCNPTIYRQAVGRVDRIGQEELTRIFFPLYSGTSQVALHSLLMQKVAVSMSTDGLDAESALRAAGIGEDSGFSSFAVGRQLYEMILSGQIQEPVVSKKKTHIRTLATPKVRPFTEEDVFNYAMQLE